MIYKWSKPVKDTASDKWIVGMEAIDGKEIRKEFNTEKEADDYISEELISYATTGLTKSQQDFILSTWDKLRFDELTRETFGNPLLDGRSKQGRMVKKFLTDRNLAPTPGYSVKAPEIELSDKDKEYIKAHAKTHNSLEMARDIFTNKSLPQLSKEHRTVDAYLKSLTPDLVGKPAVSSFLAAGDYEPPKSFEGTLKRINRFNHVQVDKDRLQPSQKKGIEFLENALNSPRFIRTINSYSDVQDRDSFESEFIRHIWDKPDLPAEEQNLYINLCADYIMMFKIQSQIEALDQKMKEVLQDPTGEVTIRLSEAISVKTKEYDSCFNRHKALTESLIGKRSGRMKNLLSENASVLLLVQAVKNEEERKRMVLMAKAKEAEVEGEIKRLETMEEFKVRILGIGKNEALYGI